MKVKKRISQQQIAEVVLPLFHVEQLQQKIRKHVTKDIAEAIESNGMEFLEDGQQGSVLLAVLLEKVYAPTFKHFGRNFAAEGADYDFTNLESCDSRMLMLIDDVVCDEIIKLVTKE